MWGSGPVLFLFRYCWIFFSITIRLTRKFCFSWGEVTRFCCCFRHIKSSQLFDRQFLKKILINTILFLAFSFLPNFGINQVYSKNFTPRDDYRELNTARYVFLVDQDSKEVLLERNADVRIYPSSMTKIMTAYVVFDQLKKGKINLDSECLIGKEAWRKNGSKMFLNYGDIVTIDQLIRGLLVVSGNDAAVALGEAISGNISNFADLMNQTAKRIGLRNSNFVNPHGLYQENHYMTLRDLATLTIRVAEDFPEYRHYFSIPEFTYAGITQFNRNPLLKSQYEGVTGMKTGHTNQGGYGVVGTATRGARRLIAVTNEVKTPRERARVITELLDYGFNNYKKVVFFERDSTVAKIRTWLGDRGRVAVAANQEVAVTLPADYLVEDLKIKIKYQDPVYVPISSGTKVATLVIESSGKQLREISLFAKENVDKASYTRRIWAIAKYKFRSFIKAVF